MMRPSAARGDADIAALASLLADPARCKVLLALDDGRALPASVLADEAGISRPTASSHLGKLTDAGLLSVETHGRNRYYRLAGPEVGELLEQLGRLAPSRPVQSLREGTRAARLRSARTCYDHFAGRLGVAVMSEPARAQGARRRRRPLRSRSRQPRRAEQTRSRYPLRAHRLTAAISSPASASNYPRAKDLSCAIASTGPNSATICPGRWAGQCSIASCPPSG